MKAAAKGEKEYVRRYSETLNTNMLYLAKPLPKTDMILRLALPTSALEKEIQQVIDFFVGVFLIISLFSLVIALFMAKAINEANC